MSDSRNGAGNLRGGGGKQTGGSGRTTKGARQKGGKNASFFEGDVDPKAAAREHLQLQMMSKKLASAVKAGATSQAGRTEQEYKKYNIEMPDPASAMKRLKGMQSFTQGWKDQEFRAKWLLRVQAVWEKELEADFEAAEQAGKLAAAGDDAGAEAVMEARAAEKAAVRTKEAQLDEQLKRATADPDNEDATRQAKEAAMAMGGDAGPSGSSGGGGGGSAADESRRLQEADAALAQRQRAADAAMAALLAEDGVSADLPGPKVCAGCGVALGKKMYSKGQWKKSAGTGRCKACADGGEAATAAGSAEDLAGGGAEAEAEAGGDGGGGETASQKKKKKKKKKKKQGAAAGGEGDDAGDAGGRAGKVAIEVD